MDKSYRLFYVFLLLVVVSMPTFAQSFDASWVYQGRLDFENHPANGLFDFEFLLFDSASGGMQVGSTVASSDLEVTFGLFSTKLDFGTSSFNGERRWLEIRVRAGSATGEHIILTPRQEILPSPYSVRSLEANNADTLDGLDSTDLLTTTGGNVQGDLSASGNISADSFELGGQTITSWPGGTWSSGPSGEIFFEGSDVGIGTAAPTADLNIKGNFSRVLSGEVTVAPGSTNVNGVGTIFGSELEIGHALKIAEEIFTVVSIISDTELTVDHPHSGGALAEPGFADSDLLIVQSGDGQERLRLDSNGSLHVQRAVVAGCPDGFSAVTSEYCIQTNENSPLAFFDALAACIQIDAHLCRYAEWVGACLGDAEPSLQNLIGSPEWVTDSEFRNASGQLRAWNPGASSCINVTNDLRTTLLNYRCCVDR